MLIYLVMTFLGGLWFSTSGVLARVGQALPTYQVMRICISLIRGGGIPLSSTLVVLGWLAAFTPWPPGHCTPPPIMSDQPLGWRRATAATRDDIRTVTVIQESSRAQLAWLSATLTAAIAGIHQGPRPWITMRTRRVTQLAEP